jgi:hypothetical protein
VIFMLCCHFRFGRRRKNIVKASDKTCFAAKGKFLRNYELLKGLRSGGVREGLLYGFGN